MHRSSETVAAIATALAKAQIELSNPEKTAVGLISNPSRGEGERTFRYAPLSAGLELVRKSLGGHQIAVLQTTEIDRPSGTVNLTTVLMHTSGEWISSDWPVCQLSDAAMPRRMGAALTYARRYSLFALVGIAGEDDNELDGQSGDRSSEQLILAETPASPPIAQGQPGRPPAATSELLSADRRRELIDQLEGLASLEALQAKAIDLLKAKNTLQPADAKAVETAFQSKLAALQGAAMPSDAETTRTEKASAPAADRPPRKRRGAAKSPVRAHTGPESRPADETTAGDSPLQPEGVRRDANGAIPPAIDKNSLAIGKPRRHRDKAHLRFVALQPCLICGRSPSDPHHLRFAQPRALGRKSSDEFVVPLCRTHHRQNHGAGDELAWWQPTSIDPLEAALKLWRSSRGVADGAP